MTKAVLTVALIGLWCGTGIFRAVPVLAQEEQEQSEPPAQEEETEPPQPAQENQVDPVQQQQQQRESACIMTGACTCLNGVCTYNATGVRFAAPPPPPKPDVWGAVAVSPSTLAYGSSWNWKSEKDAAAAALKYCGARDCKVVATVADVCLSLVESAAERIYMVGGPIGAANFADNNALLQCQRAGGRACIVKASFCADGVKHVLNGQTVFSNGNPIFVPQGQTAPFGRKQ